MRGVVSLTLCGVAILLLSNVHVGRADEKQTPCECPVRSAAWAALPDTAMVPPDFIFEPYVEIKKMFVCDHGIFFYFPSTYLEERRATCVAYPKPSQEYIARYVQDESLSVQERSQEILMRTADGVKDFDEFRVALGRLLGGYYREGRLIHFDRSSERGPKFSFGMGEMGFEWRRETIEFQALVDIYFKD